MGDGFWVLVKSLLLPNTQNPSPITPLGFDYQHGAARVADDRLGGRAEQDAPQSGAAVRRDDDEAGALLLGRAHDLGGRLAVRDHVLDFEPLELRALREGGQVVR